MIVTLVMLWGTLWGPFTHEVFLGAEPLRSRMATKSRPSEWRSYVMQMEYGVRPELKKMSKREQLALALTRSEDTEKIIVKKEINNERN